MGSVVNVVWKISNDGNSYRTIPGATNQSFTPRQEHVGRTLRVVLTYLDGQGNLETLISAPTSPVINVNDKPTGVVRLTGESAEDSALILDVSDVYDEDAMGLLIIPGKELLPTQAGKITPRTILKF